MYGLIICLAGVLNFSQSALDAATHKVFKNDPIPINVILLGLALLIGLALVGFVYSRSHKIMRENIEEEAEEARERLMPGVSVGVQDYGAVTTNTDSDGEERRGRTM